MFSHLVRTFRWIFSLIFTPRAAKKQLCSHFEHWAVDGVGPGSLLFSVMTPLMMIHFWTSTNNVSKLISLWPLTWHSQNPVVGKQKLTGRPAGHVTLRSISRPMMSGLPANQKWLQFLEFAVSAKGPTTKSELSRILKENEWDYV